MKWTAVQVFVRRAGDLNLIAQMITGSNRNDGVRRRTVSRVRLCDVPIHLMFAASVAVIFLIFDVEMVFLYPWAVAFNQLPMFAVFEGILFIMILVAGLGWAVLHDLRETEETTPLTGMDPARIEGVELTRPGRDTVKLERITGGGWRMTAPYRIAADSERVARLLGVVQAGVLRSFPASGAHLNRLGLEPEPVRISLGGQTLRFGGTEPINGLRYVASGDLVLLIKPRRGG